MKISDNLTDALVLAQRVDGLDVVVGEVLGRVPVVLNHDVVGHDDGGEYGEACNFGFEDVLEKGLFEPLGTDILFLKHGCSILRQSPNPVHS